MGRAPCCEKVGLNKGKWTKEEDQILANYINAHGEGSWRSLPKKAGLLRCGKSCRLRWINYLRAGLKRGNFSREEEVLIIKLQANLGNRWSQIASELPGRTDNDIKNYWNSHLSRSISNYHQLNGCENTEAESSEPPLKSSNKNNHKTSSKNAQTTRKTRKKKIVGKALNPQNSSKCCNYKIPSESSSLSDEVLCFNRPLSPTIFDNLEFEPKKVTSEFSFTANESIMSMDEIINGPLSPKIFDNLEFEPKKTTSEFSFTADESSMSMDEIRNGPLSPKIFDNLEFEPKIATSEFSFTADESSMMDENINVPSSPDLSSIFNEIDILLNCEIKETNVEHGDKNMLGDIMDGLLVPTEVGKEEERCLEELACPDYLWDLDMWPSMRFVEDELVLD